VADTPTKARFSRRMLFAGLGGGIASLPVLWWLDVPARVQRALRPAVVEEPCCNYVDHDGWMLTPEDAAAMAARQPAQ
jgi:hypothetical protein